MPRLLASRTLGMVEITLIVGLPGSGKTYLANQMMDSDTTLIDDLDRGIERIQQFLYKPTKKLIITEPNLCYRAPESARRQLEKWFGDITLHVISFQNNVGACWANIQRRGDDRLISKAGLSSQSVYYSNQPWSKDRPVYQP
jgi:hypothetical protein